MKEFYRAFDGTEFSSRHEASDYERDCFDCWMQQGPLVSASALIDSAADMWKGREVVENALLRYFLHNAPKDRECPDAKPALPENVRQAREVLAGRESGSGYWRGVGLEWFNAEELRKILSECTEYMDRERRIFSRSA